MLTKLHHYKPPFCERHRLGYETALSLMFQNCYTYAVGLAHYKTHQHGRYQGSHLEIFYELLEQPKNLFFQRWTSSKTQKATVL